MQSKAGIPRSAVTGEFRGRDARAGPRARPPRGTVVRRGPQAVGRALRWGPAPALEAVNRSIGTDFRLWPFDIRLSKAWAVALWNAGILTLEESRRIESGLDAVARAFRRREPRHCRDRRRRSHDDRPASARRDRRCRVEAAHGTQSKRSGVDRDSALVHGCLRQADRQRSASLQQVMVRQASAASAIADAVVHAHAARAARLGGALDAFAFLAARPRSRAASRLPRGRQAVLPLGSGAVAGCAFPISRVLLKGSLGFSAISRNSIDAVADRDFVAELLFSLALVGAHLSRLAEDLILYGSSEFGFVRFGDAYTTGSSMMPQKRNPDALELARASGARMLGDLTALLATLKGLPSGYNKDLQDDKRALFDAVDGMLLVLPAVAGTLDELTFDTARMAAAVSSTMMATDLADYLVGKGITFREAHASVGQLVRQAEETGIELDALPLSTFSAAHAAFGPDVRDALSARASVERREVEGGTGPRAVRAQLDAADRVACRRAGNQPRGNELSIRAD